MINEKPKPVVKWAGGKGQMLSVLESAMPKHFNKYIEPFVGGGALFFDISPQNAVISDANEELINMYKAIAEDVDGVINELKQYRYDKDLYYQVRAMDPKQMTQTAAAARTLYLNHTGFNGLYRVNKKGQFNVPFGRYKNPRILDEANLRAANEVLKKTTILAGDYLDVLKEYAKPGDLIFLDPPYVPVSKYSDFKRYTSNQFGEEDQKKLAQEVERLYDLGCYVMLTNSNHPMVKELYSNYDIQTFKTRRSINSNANKRTGEDILVKAYPDSELTVMPKEIPAQNDLFPQTRYMGSKEKLLPYIAAVADDLHFDSVLDLFSGSGTVSYLFKSLGKKVIANDYMTFTSDFSKALIENSDVKLSKEDLDTLLNTKPLKNDLFVEETFKDLYFSDEDNAFIDLIRSNISLFDDEIKKALTYSALARACMKRRPRGIFTYTGNRYNDGRKDLRLSLKQHFIKAVEEFNNAVFDNGKQNRSLNLDFREVNVDADLIYLDPPYYSPLSDNEYVRRYHFVEGLSRNWKGVQMQWNTKTKKFKNYPTPFSSKESTYQAFADLFEKYKNKKVIVSYSSNSLPTKDEMVEMMKSNFNTVKVYSVDYKYSFGTHKHKKGNSNNQVKEYLFVGY
ncbi:MAG TPA: Dam family site-specific DNA-(adenine-N6)-methyltransferase [Candidatus Limosilactobacillus merdigallinarum]|uniref:Site-specific DNA-methyltransferase (adenine-specific) n=1 Tax=Candidatus Limosilactobacillus merdigallinarum TaxID=2838652 RepID=A0A9D1VJ95_9LACO|nr:Dam family site-specific DNA-(adenine-N6)-methyltransferase [Candidatus Limosilactobacillus merdigallinarum]